MEGSAPTEQWDLFTRTCVQRRKSISQAGNPVSYRFLPVIHRTNLINLAQPPEGYVCPVERKKRRIELPKGLTIPWLVDIYLKGDLRVQERKTLVGYAEAGDLLF